MGGVRTLLFNWLYAKRHQGTLILRIEDTDQARSTVENERLLLEDIRRLGFDYQEGPDRGGPHAPYRQSERTGLYAKYLEELLSSDKAYFCFCKPEELAAKREAALRQNLMPLYDGTCGRLGLATARARIAKGERAGIRFRVDNHRDISMRDGVHGDVTFQRGSIGDFLITRSPGETQTEEGQTVVVKEIAPGIGFPVYNFVCVIDDHDMAITHVIRGEDHLSNTAKQILMYEAFGWKTPHFSHIPMVLGADKQKLSKRSGDVATGDYLNKGYVPEALINFLGLVGWWPPADFKPKSGHPEILSREEMIQLFDVSGVHKSAAVFDVTKLQWMNGHYLRHLPLNEAARRARPFFSGYAIPSDAWFEGMVDIVRQDTLLMSQFPAAAKIFFELPELDTEAKALMQTPEAQMVVKEFAEGAGKLSDVILPEHIGALQKEVGAKTKVKGKGLFQPIRVATTGHLHGPDLTKVLAVVGREGILKRIETVRAQVGF